MRIEKLKKELYSYAQDMTDAKIIEKRIRGTMPDSAVSNEEFAKKVTYSLIKDVYESQANFFGFDA